MFNFSEVRAFRVILFAFISGIAVFNSSCNDPEIIGLDVQPQDDLIGLIYSDTASVRTYTVSEDSLRTDETSLQLVGSYVDSIFGRSDASIYAQVIPTSAGVDFDSLPELDSLVLTLAYSGYYGDTSTPLTFHVYRVTDNMSYDSAYYSTRTFTATEELGTATIIPSPNDSVSVYGVETAPHLRININDTDLGDTLLSWSGQSQLLNSANFISAFKGLHIKVDNVSSGGSILYFNLIAAKSKMTLYYHTATDTALHYDFTFSLSHARMSHFEHDYVGSTVQLQLNDSTNGIEKVYVQAMAGVKTKIRFPNIADYIKDGMIAINKAEVEITVSDNSTDHWAAPAKLLLLGVDSLGNAVFLPDQFQGTAYYGGDYNSSTRKYKFNIAYYLQNILTGNTKDYGLYLAVSGGSVQANRAIIYGGTSTVDKIKLNLFYTKPN